jgi:hypothetical protein
MKFFFQVAAISKRFELGDRGWAHSLCLLKNVVIDLHKNNIIEKLTGRTAFKNFFIIYFINKIKH